MFTMRVLFPAFHLLDRCVQAPVAKEHPRLSRMQASTQITKLDVSAPQHSFAEAASTTTQMQR